MKKCIIHLSDLHYRLDWDEDQGLVLKGLFKDIEKQILNLDHSKVFLAFSGDIVLAGGNPKYYESFVTHFNQELERLNISKNNRILVPGNHDISQDVIAKNIIEHTAVINQNLNEKDFNDYILRQPELFTGKFKFYLSCEKQISKYGIGDENITGSGWGLDEKIGLYCLNSAIFSSGGYNNINDKEKLMIGTRSLQKWINDTNFKIRILIMHHPLNWLNEWSQTELRKILKNNFNLLLSGHNHDQCTYHTINKDSELIECSAPPILSNKKGDLGYSIITFSENGVLEICYRQWNKYNNFVTGVNFSNTDDGKIVIKDELSNNHILDKISELLKRRFEESLKSFSSQPLIWVEPVLSNSSDLVLNPENGAEHKIDLKEFLSNPKSTIIKAPPQFGLTCLAYYLSKESWNLFSNFWLYLDCRDIKLHKLDRIIDNELDLYGLQKNSIMCIILDSWTEIEADHFKILKQLCESYKDTPIIVMHTIDESKIFSEPKNQTISRDFEVYHLLALPRNKIRKVVSAYNAEKHIADEDIVLTKVVSDLEVLNIPRTPLNCITLLKVSEKYFDESPVNRTKMLEMVLFLLFNLDEIPTYKSKPDLKDCEYVLGRFCEKLIKNKSNFFTRENFINDIRSFCDEKLIDLEVEFVFDILYSNNIIVKREFQFGFRFSYWVYYFAARRMHHDKEFCDYIFNEKRYILFPEIIEFYTGIDRMRDDAIKIIHDDLKKTCEFVKNKVGLPEDINPFKMITWDPTPENIQEMQNEISEKVLKSNLPADVKDQHEDQFYNQLRPYNQTIQYVFEEYSVATLMQGIKAASRALRNSDYIQPDLKRALLREIFQSWLEVSKVLIALTPLLAMRGNVKFDGVSFYLCNSFGKTPEEKAKNILKAIPFNVVNWFKSDLFSNKMGPLFYDNFKNEKDDIKKHELALLISQEKPRQWKSQIQDYIYSLNKNSFYLSDIFVSLRNQYQYSFSTPVQLKEIEYLIKMIAVKYTQGIKHPTLDKIVKIPNKILPKREFDNDDNEN